MPDFFNPRRFSRLFMKHTAEHYRSYLMSMAVLAGVILLGGSFLFFVIPQLPDPGLETAIYMVMMPIAGTLFTSTVFSDLGDKRKAIPALTLPASAFEKFLVGWLYSYPIFLLVYTAIFSLAVFGFAGVRHWEPAQNGFPIHHYGTFTLWQYMILFMIVIYSLLHAIAIYGAIFFRRLHFVATGFIFFIGFALALVANSLFLKILTGLDDLKMAMPFSFLNFGIGNNYYSVKSGPFDQLMTLVLFMGVALIIWIAAYFKLKEKQV